MENKIIKTNTIWYKITRFFRKLLGKRINNNIDDSNISLDRFNENETSNNESDFKNRINTRDEEKERILKLQQQLRNKQILEEEISEEDTKKILELYDEQIMNLENEIKNNTALLEKYKKKLEDEEG